MDVAKAGWYLSAKLREPWVVKDPRLVTTLEDWIEPMTRFRPLLIWIERDRGEVLASWRKMSHHKRGARQTIDRLHSQARMSFRQWPFPKMHIRKEKLDAALKSAKNEIHSCDI